MSNEEGSITTEVRGHIMLIGLNRPEKYNGYTPTMAKQLIAAMTLLDEDVNLWVGVIFGHGDHFTAGLDLPKWTGRMEQGGSGTGEDAKLDVVGLGRACRKPIVTAVHGEGFSPAMFLDRRDFYLVHNTTELQHRGPVLCWLGLEFVSRI